MTTTESNLTDTQITQFVLQDAIEILTAGDDSSPADWARVQTDNPRLIADEYGNSAHFYIANAGSTGILVIFEYALGRMVETLTFDATGGATRIAKIISTMSEPPED